MSAEEQDFRSDRYKVIPRVLIFSTRGDQLLLIKGAPHKKLWPNLYNGIGGHVEPGETILSAAKREFFEETGLTITDPTLRALITIDTGHKVGIGLFVFCGTAGTGELISSPEGALEWIDPERVSQLPVVDDLVFLLPKILKNSDPGNLFYGRYRYDQKGKLLIDFED